MSELSWDTLPEDVQATYTSTYDRLQNDLESLQRSLEDLQETAYSPDGLVAATVGARGELKELVLDPRIYRTSDAKALSASITETVHEATEAVTMRIVELTKPLLPKGLRTDGDSEFGLAPMLRKLTGRAGEA